MGGTPMQASDSLSEVIVYVAEMDRMVEFYTEAFDLAVTRGAPEHGFVALDAGGVELALHAGREGEEGELGPYAPKLVFEVDDLAAAREYLEAFDVELGEVRNPAPETHVVDGRDPEGNNFSIEASSPPA